MSVDSNLRTLALQNAAVTTQIGSRFFINWIPEIQGGMTYPCVRAQTITDPFARTHGGTYGGRALVQLDVFDNDEATCNIAADALTSWLDNYRGGMGAYNVTVQIKNRMGGWEEESRLFRRILEVEILYMT